MNNLYVDNLGIIITEKCNLNCAHCFRGDKQCRDISFEVIDAIVNQVKAMDILNICGGAPTMAVDKLSYLFKKIIEKRILVRNICITINGTIYNAKLMEMCQKMNEYIRKRFPDGGVGIYVSFDKYHLEEMQKRGISFQKEIFKSPYYAGVRELDDNLKLFREGNAEFLDTNLTIPLKPMKIFILDCSDKSKSITYRIGPFITINIDGTITEDNTTYDKQQTVYNYGNVLTGNLVNSLLDNGVDMMKSKIMYRVLCKKEIKRFMSYNE